MALDPGTISLIDITSPDITLGGIIDSNLAPNLKQAILAGSGEVDATFSGVLAAKPLMGFTTRALATALGAAGIDGAECTTLDTYLQAIAPYGTREGASSHTKLTFGKAFLVPRTLTCTVGPDGPEPATLQYDVIGLSTDGSTAPITISADTQSIPAGGNSAEAFTMGPITINGSALEPASLTIDFGLDVRVEGYTDPFLYPTLAYILNRRPSIQIATPDRLALNTFGLTGAAQGETDTVIKLRKLLAGGTRSTSADNITLTVDAGRIAVDSVAGSHGERIGSNVTITPIYDGTAAVIAIATNAAA